MAIHPSVVDGARLITLLNDAAVELLQARAAHGPGPELERVAGRIGGLAEAAAIVFDRPASTLIGDAFRLVPNPTLDHVGLYRDLYVRPAPPN